MSTRYPFIKSILQKKKIVEYLASEHIFPVRQYTGRFVYTCPLHADKSPSFYIFDDGDYQTFKCFGCSKGGDLINLICFLKNYTTSEAIRKIAGDLNITEKDRVVEIGEFVRERDSEGEKIDSLDEFCLLISRTLFNYLGDVDYDVEELRVVDAIYQKIDPIIRARDSETLQAVYEGIADRLIKRQRYVMNKREKKILNAN